MRFVKPHLIILRSLMTFFFFICLLLEKWRHANEQLRGLTSKSISRAKEQANMHVVPPAASASLDKRGFDCTLSSYDGGRTRLLPPKGAIHLGRSRGNQFCDGPSPLLLPCLNALSRTCIQGPADARAPNDEILTTNRGRSIAATSARGETTETTDAQFNACFFFFHI